MMRKIILGASLLSATVFGTTTTTNINMSANLFKPVSIMIGSAETTLNILKTKTGNIELPNVDLNITGAPGKSIVLEANQVLAVAKDGNSLSLNVSFGSGTSTDGTKATLIKVLEPSGTYNGQLNLSGNIPEGTTLVEGTYNGSLAITAKYN